MAETIPPIDKWRHVFLDTSVLIDLIVKAKNLPPGEYRNRVEFTQSLFAKIKVIREEEKKPAFFYVSAITIGELLKLDSRNVRHTIVATLSSENLEVIDYSNEVASDLNRNLKKYIPLKEYKAFETFLLKRLDNEKAASGRQWIKDDFKIGFCARSVRPLDVLLTGDKRTFIPICQKLEIPVLSTCGERFNRDLLGEILTDTSITP